MSVLAQYEESVWVWICTYRGCGCMGIIFFAGSQTFWLCLSLKLLFNYLIGGHIQLLYKRLVACTGLAHAWHNNTLHPPPTPQSAGVYLPVGSTTSSENYGYVCGYMGIISFAGHHTYGSVCPS